MRTEAILSARKVSRIFPGGEVFPAGEDGEPFRALDGVDLDVYRGELLLIAGSNGSGKTLLMRILAALTECSGGEVLYRGRPLQETAKFRAALGLVFQDAASQIVRETVLEDAAFGPRNLGYPKEAAAAAARRALEAVGLADKAGVPARRLSGGEKRRLAIAGVLAMGCETIIFDEPFANLDWPGVQSVLRIIRDLKNEGRTLVILTHELEKVLALADRLLILHRGRVRDGGAPEEVLARLPEECGVRNPLRGGMTLADCLWLD